VGELPCQLSLLQGLGDPLLDLPPALRAAGTQPALELLLTRRRDEDRDAVGDPVPDGERAAGLQLEQGGLAASRDPVDLRAQRAGALAVAPRPLDPFEEVVGREPAVELFARQEPVVPPVDLARPPLSRRRRNRELELRNALEQQPRQGALPLAGRAGDDEDGRALRRGVTC
jgi:hypothetical protein